MNINMDNNTAKEIITKYIFANYDMDVLNRYLNINNQDQLHRKALLTEALRKAIIALSKEDLKPYQKNKRNIIIDYIKATRVIDIL